MVCWYRLVHRSGLTSQWFKNVGRLDLVLGLLRNGYDGDSQDSPGLVYELAIGDSPRYRTPVGTVGMDPDGRLTYNQRDGPTVVLREKQ